MTINVMMENQARILVVQDDPVLLGLVSGSLRPDGHYIIEVSSPLDALDISALEFEHIDLIVTAVNSRPITGIELAKRLTSKGVDVPMLFMSASRALAGVIAKSLGQTAVIEEPFTGSELRASVRKCLSGHRRKPRVEC